MEKEKKTTNQEDRKLKLLPFYQYLTHMGILKDLTAHKVLLTDSLEMDQLKVKRLSSQVIENVPLKFVSLEHYKEIWERLFYQQAKCQIYRSKQEEAKQPELVEFLQLRNSENNQKSGFKLFLFQRLPPVSLQKSTFNIGNLVILSPVKPQRNSNYPHLIGFVQQGENLTVRAIFDESIEKKNKQQWDLMVSTKRWYIQEICSINSLERQFYALANIGKINKNLLELILKPDLHVKETIKKFSIPINLDKKLKQTYNQSQYKAINECLKEEGITLIQGPPGTGKTKTVLGTLSVLLSSYQKSEQQQNEPLLLNWKKSSQVPRDLDRSLNPWLYEDFADWRDFPYIENDQDPLNLTSTYIRCDVTDRRVLLKKKEQQIELPQKVLICGPSNASVDEIIRKLIKQQLINKDGNSFLPNFVRIGDNYDPSLKQYSLQFLVEKLGEKQHNTDYSYLRSKILNEYRLVFGTLSSAGNQIMESAGITFDTVVIDEAGQSIEIANLIPLLYGCQRLILIGDPNQLPATIFSQKSLEHKYDQSLFQRLMKSGYPVNILKTQYRMHPDISFVIGKYFYGQKLLNWENITIEKPILGNSGFIFFHLEHAPESGYKKSFRNFQQAKAVKQIGLFLGKYYEDIGIISPYSQQVSYIHNLMGKNKKCEVKTIDSFQGRQKSVIVFSTVRSRYVNRNKKVEQNKRKTIGFVGDLRRINVSLSRAKNLCIIVGDAKRLIVNPTWKCIIEEAISKNQVFSFNSKKNFLQSFQNDCNKYRIQSLE